MNNPRPSIAAAESDPDFRRGTAKRKRAARRDVLLSNLAIGLVAAFVLSASGSSPARAQSAGAAGTGTGTGDTEPSAADTGAETDPMPMPAVEFNPDRSAVFDPFFPDSEYHKPVEKEETGVIAKPPPNPYEHLEVRGIISGATRRLATINNYTFAVGEVISVRVPGPDGKGEQMLRVKCLKIRRNSVVVMIEGQSKPGELFLKSAF